MANDEGWQSEGQPPCLIGTLGMFIIDQFRFEDEQTGEDLGDRGIGNQIGGGGTYFAIGARMWLSPEKVLMVVDRGDDITEEEQAKMSMYASEGSVSKGQHCLWRYRSRSDGQGTTRAINIYRGQERGFAYLTLKKRLEPQDLLCESMPYLPKFIHCICSPSRAKEICTQIDSLKRHWYQGRRPMVVWEPIPDSAIPENLNECLDVFDHIDIISPNHEEAASFFSVKKSDVSTGKDVRKNINELIVDRLYAEAGRVNVQKVPMICIRCGALGAVISASKEQDPIWIDAYHTPAEVDKVVDVTGAGNSWLGGFTAGLAFANEEHHLQHHHHHQDSNSWTLEQIRTAAQMASVSASLVVEQQSLPTLQIRPDKTELWNGKEISIRLRRLQDRG